MKSYHYEKGVGKFLATVKGGHNKFCGSFFVVAGSFSRIEGGMQNICTL